MIIFYTWLGSSSQSTRGCSFKIQTLIKDRLFDLTWRLASLTKLPPAQPGNKLARTLLIATNDKFSQIRFCSVL